MKNVRNQVTAAAAFLDWLDTRGLTLAACTQAELYQRLAGNPATWPGRRTSCGGRSPAATPPAHRPVSALDRADRAG